MSHGVDGVSELEDSDFKLHQCTALPENGIDVLYSRNGIDSYDIAWNLIIRRESTEEDLEENHYLEEVGETMWETILEISHCPYCGETLSKVGEGSEGKFLHRDYSGWSVKIQ